MAKAFLQPTSPENSEGVRRMVAGWQAVEAQEREERRQAGPDTAIAIRGALELMDLFGARHGWPPPENEARRRDYSFTRSNKPAWIRPNLQPRENFRHPFQKGRLDEEAPSPPPARGGAGRLCGHSGPGGQD